MPLSKEKDRLRKRAARVRPNVQPVTKVEPVKIVLPVIQPSYRDSFHPCPKSNVRGGKVV